MTFAEYTVEIEGNACSLIDQGAGDVIVFLHGFPLNKQLWAAQLTALQDSYRVVAPDLRGHGRSGVSEGVVTMRQMAEDVLAVLEARSLKQPVTLCGLSMGGYVALEFWRCHRERLKRLILCDTRAAADSVEVARGRVLMAANVLRDGAATAAQVLLPKLLGPQTQATLPGKVAEIREMILATPPQGIAAAQRGMAERADFTADLSRIDVPTLVLCGAQDGISPPAEMRAIADAMPQARYQEIPDAGHLAPFEQPQAVNDAIRQFLAVTS